MSSEDHSSPKYSAALSFIMPKALSMSNQEAKVYTIGPWIHFVEPGRVRDLVDSIDEKLWVETLDEIPPETLLLIEHGETLRLTIDVGESTTKETIKKAFDIAKKWQEALRGLQGYRVENERDRYIANLDRARKHSSYAQTAENFNRYVAIELRKIYDSWIAKEDAKPFSQEWTIAGMNHRHALIRIRKTLSFIFSDERVEEILKEGMERIIEGLPPFEREYPLSKDHLKETVLREWKRRTGGKVHKQDGGEK